MRKQLVVTCSERYIKIWNYATRSLEIQMQTQVGEEMNAVAFHPSGFHIVVAYADKVVMMNVLSNSIKEFNTFQNLKGCRDIRFSNGGHYFACGLTQGAVHIFNFYTGECPQNMLCKGHVSKVRALEWFADDMGFASAAMDGNCFFYDLQAAKESGSGQRNNERDFNQKGVNWSGMCLIPDMDYECLAVGSDRKVWMSKEKKYIDTKRQLSQIQIMANAKTFFAGVGEEGKPGSIEIWRLPLERKYEVQAHSGPIERMRISHDNQFLFTSGRDGSMMMFEIKDKDMLRGGAGRKFEGIANFSEEILTEKTEMDQYE